MTATTASDSTASLRGSAVTTAETAASRRRLRQLLLIAWVCLVTAVLLTRVPDAGTSPKGLWVLLGSLLLWWVYSRGSYLAWAISGVLAFSGAIIFAFGVSAGAWEATMCALYLGQGVALLTKTVRRHVG